MKNYLDHAITLTLLALLMLISLSYLPVNLSPGGFTLRNMDIFSDVRADAALPFEQTEQAGGPSYDTTYYSASDTIGWASLDSSARAMAYRVDTSDYGRIIEDYTYGQHGLARFFYGIDSIRYGKSVRIAWYGDSFVEGDILIGDLRDTLQGLWGGRGVGFVPVTSEVAQFRRTIKHQFGGWNTFSIIKKNGPRPPAGINGYACQPSGIARLSYEGTSSFARTRSWTDVRLFYSSASTATFTWKINSDPARDELLDGGNSTVRQWKWPGNGSIATAFSASFPQTDSLLVYGAALEGGPGFYIDNFSVRGNSGGALCLLKPDVIQSFTQSRPYDLVVLQVGLNAVTNSLNNIAWYESELDKTVRHLKNCFPGVQILIVSVGDRGGKNGEELSTMKSVYAISEMQRNLARRHGVLFFDLFHGMGGTNSIIRMAAQRPRLANTDYTHLTHDGGRVVGLMLADLFVRERIRYSQK
jgi:lysophospholipase L1-like esterase